MKELLIVWQRLIVGARTCERCGNTGANLERAAERLRAELEPKGVRVVLERIELSPAALAGSNSVTCNGVPVEELLEAGTGSSPCPSCCEMLGAPADCRTLRLNGREFEAIPEAALFRAGMEAARRLAATPKEET